MITLAELMASQSPVVRDKAGELLRYQKEYQAGMLSRPEYDDLCADSLSLDEMEHLASNLVERQLIQAAFEALVTIASEVK